MEQLSRKIVVACAFCKSLFKVSISLSGKQVTCTKCRRIFTAVETTARLPHSEDNDFFLCKLALNYGLLNEKQLEHVFTEYSKRTMHNEKVCLEPLLTEYGGLSADHVSLLKGIRDNWSLRQIEKHFAAQAVEKKYISVSQAKEALIEQARHFYKTRETKLLCDILTESGLMSPAQCKTILSSAIPVQKAPPSALQVADAGPSASPPRPREKAVIAPSPAPSPPRTESTVSQSLSAKAVDNKAIASDHQGQQARERDAVPPPKPMEPLQRPTAPTPLEKIEQQKIQPAVTVPAATPDPLAAAVPADIPEPIAAVRPPTRPDSGSSSHDTRPVHHDAPTPKRDKMPPAAQPEDSSDLTGSGARKVMFQGVELIISRDGLLATLRVPPGVDPSTMDVEDIKAVLREEDIVYGIVDDALIRGFLNSKIFKDKPFNIAEGKLAEPGKNGHVKYFFDTDYLKIGAVSESGAIDFKNRGEIPYVTEGTILAEINPAIPGKNGRNIFGQDLPVPDVKSVSIKCEKGVSLSEDGRKAIATVNGQPKLGFGDRLHVLTEIVIPGDVGFETGHVEFEGNIIIKGTVHNDFHVTGANITANEVLQALITAKGDLVVSSGITGATLDVEGNIKAKFINKSTINAYGNIVVDKEIIDCTIQTSGVCAVTNGKIISSTISAKQGIEAQDIGTEISTPCRLKIGVDDHISQEISLIEDQVDKLKSTLENYEKTMKELEDEEKEVQKIIAELAHIQDRSQLEIKNLRKTLEQTETDVSAEKTRGINAQLEALSKKVNEADTAINNNFNKQDDIERKMKEFHERIWGCKEQIMSLNKQKKDKRLWADSIKTRAFVKTKGPIYTGTAIAGKHSSRILKETMRSVKIAEVRSSESAEGWEIKLV